MWEIITYGGGAFLVDIFNAIAAISNNGNYMAIIRIFLIASLFWILLQIAFGSKFDISIKWYICTILLLNALFLPRVNVLIIDRLNRNLPAAQVANVPYGLAVFASLTSRVGDELTRLLEINFALPDDMQFQRSGMLMPAKLVEESRKFNFVNSQNLQNMQGFTKQCIFYDLLLGFYSFEDLRTSPDIWSLVSRNAAVNRMFVMHEDGKTSLFTCKEGIPILRQMLNKERQNSLNKIARNFYPAQSQDQARTSILLSLPNAYRNLLGISKNAAEIVEQNMMINLIYDGVGDFVQKTGNRGSNSASMLAYMSARSDSQTTSSFAATGLQAEKWVPILRIVIESLYYGMFPLAFLVMLTPIGTRVVQAYFFGFIWLQSWGPLYAILHRIMMGYAEDSLLVASRDISGTAGVNIANFNNIMGISNDISVMAGYLTMSIPFLAAAIVKGAGAGISGLATSLLAVPQSAATQSASEAATGNVNIGNYRIGSGEMMNTSSFQHRTSPMFDAGRFSSYNADNYMLTQTANGSMVADTSSAISKFSWGANISNMLSSSANRQVETSLRQGQEFSQSASQSMVTSYVKSGEWLEQTSSSRNNNHEYSSSLRSDVREAFNKIEASSSSFAKDIGSSKQDAVRMLAAASASVGIGSAANSASWLSWLKGNLGLRGEIAYSSDEVWQESWKKAMDYAKRNDLSKAFDISSANIETSNFAFNDSKAESIREALSTSLNNAQNFETRRNNFEQEAHNLSQIRGQLESSGAVFQQNITQKLFDLAAQERDLHGEKLGYAGALKMFEPKTPREETRLQNFIDNNLANIASDLLAREVGVLGSKDNDNFMSSKEQLIKTSNQLELSNDNILPVKNSLSNKNALMDEQMTITQPANDKQQIHDLGSQNLQEVTTKNITETYHKNHQELKNYQEKMLENAIDNSHLAEEFVSKVKENRQKLNDAKKQVNGE